MGRLERGHRLRSGRHSEAVACRDATNNIEISDTTAVRVMGAAVLIIPGHFAREIIEYNLGVDADVDALCHGPKVEALTAFTEVVTVSPKEIHRVPKTVKESSRYRTSSA
jgi:hypothetical protein